MRTHKLLFESEAGSVYEITWPPGTGLDWHHHGVSAAYIHVMSGTLTEWDGLSEDIYQYETGEWWRVPAGRKHKIVNLGDVDAVSIHVYSPRLTVTYEDTLEITP